MPEDKKLTICLSFNTPLSSPHYNWHHLAQICQNPLINRVINISDSGAHSLSPWQHVIPDTEQTWFQQQMKTLEL